jgi:hypothetical protein
MTSTRTLKHGDPTPAGQPSRYLNDRGYVRLRWLVGSASYIEVYEHRLVMGLPPRELEVHHINHVKTDNRRENLVVLTKIEHAKLHAALTPNQYKGKPRKPLSEYPACTVGECSRPGQCINNTLCLMHYKRWKRHGSVSDAFGKAAA